MLLSVIVINYNTFALTCDCIRSIQKTTRLEHEIILVDNNSRECRAERFLEAFPQVRLIALKENVGFGRANNRGVAEARGKYVLLLNSDTVVHEATLDKTVHYLETHPGVDILGCKVVRHNSTVQKTVVADECERRVLNALKFLIKRNTLFLQSRIWIQSRLRKNGKRTEVVEATEETSGEENTGLPVNFHNGKRIGCLIGVFVLLKRNVYLESKGFDPDFFMYFEEMEWFANRLHRYNVVYYPFASITHKQGGSDVHKKMSLQYFVSQHLFWYKMGYPQYILFLLFSVVDIPSRMLVRLFHRYQDVPNDVSLLIRSFAYTPFILRHSNKYGSRREVLKLRSLQKNNL